MPENTQTQTQVDAEAMAQIDPAFAGALMRQEKQRAKEKQAQEIRKASGVSQILQRMGIARQPDETDKNEDRQEDGEENRNGPGLAGSAMRAGWQARKAETRAQYKESLSGYADELRRSKNFSSIGTQAKGDLGKAGKSLKKLKAKKALGEVSQAGKHSTAMFLRFCWFNVITTYGATIILLDIYAFFRWIPPFNLFTARMGEEWLPKSLLSKMGSKAGEQAGDLARLSELMVLGILNLIIVFGIIFILAMFIILLDFWGFLWEFAKQTLGL